MRKGKTGGRGRRASAAFGRKMGKAARETWDGLTDKMFNKVCAGNMKEMIDRLPDWKKHFADFKPLLQGSKEERILRYFKGIIDICHKENYQELNWHLDKIKTLLNAPLGEHPSGGSSTPSQVLLQKQPIPCNNHRQTNFPNIVKGRESVSTPDMPAHGFPSNAPYVSVAIWQDVLWGFCSKNPLLSRYFGPTETATALNSACQTLLHILLQRHVSEIHGAPQSSLQSTLKTFQNPTSKPPVKYIPLRKYMPHNKIHAKAVNSNKKNTGRKS